MTGQRQPKYDQIVHWVKERVHRAELLPGDRLESENELARVFGVSRQTARQAVGILENEGLVLRRRGSGTYITDVSSPLHEPTKTIGVITTYLDDYIFPGIIRGIERVLSLNGYTMQLAITNNRVESETKALAQMLQNDVDGLIVEPTKSALPNLNRDLFSQLTSRHIPCLMIHGAYAGIGFPCVAPDDRAGGYAAAEYLTARGHLHIGGVFKSDDIQGHLRYAGFARALKERGISLDDGTVLWYATEDVPRLFGGESDDYLLSRFAHCTGLVCYNDQIALKLMDMLRRGGYPVPERMSLIGFDNSDLATLSDVGLTSVAHPKEQLGETAAIGILNLIEEPSRLAGRLFDAVIAERQSVRDLRARGK